MMTHKQLASLAPVVMALFSLALTVTGIIFVAAINPTVGGTVLGIGCALAAAGLVLSYLYRKAAE